VLKKDLRWSSTYQKRQLVYTQKWFPWTFTDKHYAQKRTCLSQAPEQLVVFNFRQVMTGGEH